MSYFWDRSGENIIHSFTHFRIVRVVKLVESCIGDIGMGVLFQEIIDMIMIIFAPVIFFSYHFHLHHIDMVGCKAGLFFTPFVTKIMIF